MKGLFKAIFAIAGVLGVNIVLYLNAVPRCIISVVMFFFTYKAYDYAFKNKNVESKLYYVPWIVLTVLYSSLWVLGLQLDNDSGIQFKIETLLIIVLVSMGIYPFVLCAAKLLDNTKTEGKKTSLHLLKICFLLIIIAWGATYLALFPGVYGTDAPCWYFEFSRSDVKISSQWSPLYCWFFYSFVTFGKTYFNSYTIGFAIFSFIQMAFTLCIIWRILLFTNKEFNSKCVILVTLFYLMPMHAILAITSAQDAIFSPCFAMVVLYLTQYVLDKDLFLNKKNIFSFMFWIVFMCVIRNNGMYAMSVVLIIAVLMKEQRRLIFAIIGSIMIVIFYQGPVYEAIGIEKGTAIREMLSLPLQQMAYTYNYSNKLTDAQRKEMELYIPEEGWKSYTPCISDPVKSYFDDLEGAEKGNFAKLYIRLLVENPEEFLQGAGLQTFGLWYPNKQWPDYRTWHPYIDIMSYDSKGWYDSDFTIYRESKFPIYESFLEILFGKGESYNGYGGNLDMIFDDIPVFGNLCRIGTYTWILAFALFYAVYKKWNTFLMTLGLEMGLWLTVFLSPVIMYRYCAPIIFSTPLYILLLFNYHKNMDAN